MAVKFSSVRSVTPIPFAESWDELRIALSDHREVESKMVGELWSPANYLPNTTRGSVNVESVSYFVADLDGESLSSVGAVAQNYAHCAYSTWSHTVSSPHFHLVFPLACPVPVSEWWDVWSGLHEHLGIEGDPATKDPARIYFLPQHPIGAPFHYSSHDGDLLDPLAHRVKTHRAVRTRVLSGSRRVAVPVLDPKWWDAPVDLSQYDGMTQAEIHKDMQRKWAALRSRMKF
jgi:hypothetical protein